MTDRPPAEATVLAFDFGTRRVGVAVGNTLLRAAHPLATIDEERADPRFEAIASLVAQWQPGLFVVGVPLHADGTGHALTSRARRFARQLHGRFGVPVVEIDERYTTQLAQSEVRGSGPRGRARRDAVAAQIILQAYFDEHA